jgi:hypothetical protein
MLVLVLLVGVFIVAVGLGFQYQRLGAATLAATAFLALLWILAYYAISIDWHDADGSSDCWPRCSALQRAISAVLFGAPLIAGSLLVIAFFTPTMSRAQGKGENRILLVASLITLLAFVMIGALTVR